MLIRLLIVLVLASGVFGGAYYAIHKLYLEPERRLLVDKQLPPPTPPPDPSIEAFAQLQEMRKTAPPETVRAAFERFLKEYPQSKQREGAFDVIGEINSAEFFAMKPTDANTYVVKAGDSLGRVSARTKLPLELIIHLNKLERDMIHPGQKLLAPPCEFQLLLRQKQRRVVLYKDGKFFRQYPVVAWPGANKIPPVFLPAQSARILDKIAIGAGGAAVKPTELAYFNAAHIIKISIPNHSLYSLPPEGSIGPRPDGGGIALAPAHASEIAILLSRSSPVTME